MDTANEEETRAYGRQLAGELPASGVVLLIGDLGAGKTTLTKGIAEGLGLNPDEISSPTYTLVHEYGDPPRLHHADLYRLDTEEEVNGLGLDELIEGKTLLLVEWGERFPHLFPPDRTEIRISYLDEDRRRIEISTKPENPKANRA